MMQCTGALAGSEPPSNGSGTGGKCIEPPHQRRTVGIAQMAPALLGDVHCTT